MISDHSRQDLAESLHTVGVFKSSFQRRRPGSRGSCCLPWRMACRLSSWAPQPPVSQVLFCPCPHTLSVCSVSTQHLAWWAANVLELTFPPACVVNCMRTFKALGSNGQNPSALALVIPSPYLDRWYLALALEFQPRGQATLSQAHKLASSRAPTLSGCSTVCLPMVAAIVSLSKLPLLGQPYPPI